MRKENTYEPSNYGFVPLVTSEEAMQGLAYIQNLANCESQDKILVRDWHAGLFAFAINQDNMIPRFYPGYQAIVDATRLPESGDFVLVHFNHCQLYQYIEQQGQLWLLADVDGNDKILLDDLAPEDYIIQGVVISTIMENVIDEGQDENFIESFDELSIQAS